MPAHFVLANEVADALPVRRALVRGGRFYELLVDAELQWLVAKEPQAPIEAYFGELHVAPPEGSIVDVCLELDDWLQDVVSRMDKASVGLVIDYTASPPRDSLLTYYRHTLGSDPLVRLGQQDISARVDLRTLVRLAIRSGLRAGAVAQRGLLFNLGFPQVEARSSGMTDRQALAHLVDADAAGGQIVAVFLLRGMPPDYTPAGALGREWPEPRAVPSLPPDPDESDFLDQWHEAFGSGAAREN
jgi:SAM-dependent MidA family methyltransferase